MRTYPMRAALCLLLVLLFCDIPKAAASTPDPALTTGQIRERVGLRAASDYAHALDRFAETMRSRVVCPVPASTGFVDSWGAPRAGHTHIGVDIMAPELSPIYAPQTGVLRNHGNDSWYLDGRDGSLWFGTHDHSPARGDGPVNAGDLIAYVGHTGNASAGADHLHLQHAPDGVTWQDPYPIIAAACNRQPTEAARRRYYPADRPTFPFRVAAVHRWINSTRPAGDRIDRRTAEAATIWLNGLVLNYLSRLNPSCSPGDPVGCERLVRTIASRYGVDPNAAVSVARCESGLNPSASNGSHGGLFQQDISAFPDRAASRGFGGRSVWDPTANASVSMMMVREDGSWQQWSCPP